MFLEEYQLQFGKKWLNIIKKNMGLLDWLFGNNNVNKDIERKEKLNARLKEHKEREVERKESEAEMSLKEKIICDDGTERFWFYNQYKIISDPIRIYDSSTPLLKMQEFQKFQQLGHRDKTDFSLKKLDKDIYSFWDKDFTIGKVNYCFKLVKNIIPEEISKNSDKSFSMDIQMLKWFDNRGKSMTLDEIITHNKTEMAISWVQLPYLRRLIFINKYAIEVSQPGSVFSLFSGLIDKCIYKNSKLIDDLTKQKNINNNSNKDNKPREIVISHNKNDPKADFPKAIKNGSNKLQSSDYEGAISEFNKAIKIQPRYADSYNLRGLCKTKLKDAKGALSDFNKAIKLKLDFASAYMNRGDLKASMNDFKGALEDYHEVIRIDPTNTLIYDRSGMSKQLLQDFEGSIQDFNKGIELDPKNSDLFFSRGVSKVKINDKKGALNDFKSAKSLGNTNAINYLKTIEKTGDE